jgi:hypothetical protein
MTWLLWRQHRAQSLIVAVGLVLFGIAVLVTGVHMAHEYDKAIRSCGGSGTCDFVADLFRGDGAIVDLVHSTIALPLVLGVFLGAPLVARETEHATNSLAWTQTVTRRRWLTGKLVTVFAITIATTAAVSALVTWWSGTMNSLNGNRFEGVQFDTQNIAPIAFAIFAVALGLAAGALFRRTLPAIGVTVGGYFAIRLVVAVHLRPHYMKPVTQSVPLSLDPHVSTGSWRLAGGTIVDASGHELGNILPPVPDACARFADGKGGALNCLGRLGYHQVVQYQPASRYWHFQWVEAGIFVALAAALVAYAVVRSLRHDA